VTGMPQLRERIRIPTDYEDLLERPLIAHVATLRPDGDLQSNPVWFEWNGEQIRLSHTKRRQKYRNVRRYPKAALSIVDDADPYRYLEIRGDVEDIVDDPDNVFIDRLAQRYLDEERYPWHQPGDERIIVAIRPTSTTAMGGH
jgi:PPOX class probable F420-dependent enzyme